MASEQISDSESNLQTLDMDKHLHVAFSAQMALAISGRGHLRGMLQHLQYVPPFLLLGVEFHSQSPEEL